MTEAVVFLLCQPIFLPNNYSIIPTSTRLSRSAKARGWSKEMLQAARLTCELVRVSMMAVLVVVVVSIMVVSYSGVVYHGGDCI